MVDKINLINSQAKNQQATEVQSKTSECANNIFSQMDSDNDGIVTKAEANLFGFTTLGEQSISIAQFEQIFERFREKTSTQSKVIEDFDNIFYDTSNTGEEYPVSLSEKQKHELLSRIELFEAYYSVLNTNDKNAIKNSLCGTYEDKTKFLTKIKISLQKGDFNGISRQEVAECLDFLTFNKIESDRKIGTFHQGNLGDCYFLSLLNTYSSSPDGEKNIKDRIRRNPDGSYTVSFNNPIYQYKKEEIIVSEEDLKALDDENSPEYHKGAFGDVDVRILEIATDRLLEKYLPENHKKELASNGNKLLEGSDLIKEYIIHRAFGYTIPPVWIRQTDGTGKSFEEVTYNAEIADNGKLKDVTQESLTRKQFASSSLADLIQEKGYKSSELTIGQDGRAFNETESGIGHEYNLMRINDTYVIVNNPHQSIKPIILGKHTGEIQYFTSTTYYPQSHRIPISECK